jgi:hypothetical protein
MNTEQIQRIETMMDRALSAEEKERLGRIQTTLGVADNDALWDVLAAVEYQRTFYHELPQQIGATATQILQGITTAAEKETAAAQARLADSVVEQAKKLSTKINYATLLPMGMAALVCLLAYGSLLLWAGFRIGSGQTHDLSWILRMPSGFLMAGLCLAGGLLLGVYTRAGILPKAAKAGGKGYSWS